MIKESNNLFYLIAGIPLIQLSAAEEETVVGYVHSNTTLTCERSFYNYPEWYGPNGDNINYMYGAAFDANLPYASRLMWASNRRDLIIKDTQTSDAGNYECTIPITEDPPNSAYTISLKVRGTYLFTFHIDTVNKSRDHTSILKTGVRDSFKRKSRSPRQNLGVPL